MARSTATQSEQEDAIVKAAAEEVALVGLGRASLDVIATQAGVSRRTLYRRFPTRDALITELGRRTFEAAMHRLRTVSIDSGPADAAVAAFCEGLRLLTTEPVMRRFLRLDTDFSAVAGAYDQAKIFMQNAGEAMTKALRAAGATMPDEDLLAVADLHIRLACSLAQVPSPTLDVHDDAAVRDYARRHLAALVW